MKINPWRLGFWSAIIFGLVLTLVLYHDFFRWLFVEVIGWERFLEVMKAGAMIVGMVVFWIFGHWYEDKMNQWDSKNRPGRIR